VEHAVEVANAADKAVEDAEAAAKKVG